MFGSLVIAYPTPHAGGTLRFSKGEKTWDLDSATLLAQLQEPSLAYAVFFSDTDHEVLPVTSGHRVTITYNLHLAPELGEDDSVLSVKTQIPIQLKDDETAMASMIQSLLDSPTFMPKGGLMGFGLQYQYSVSDRVSGSFDDIFTRLKGVDAAVVGACKQLGLKTKGKALSKSNSGLYWLLDEIPSLEGWYGGESSLDDEFQDGILVGGDDGQEGMGDRFVWITEANRNARSGKQTFAGYYGNEVRTTIRRRLTQITCSSAGGRRILRGPLLCRSHRQTWLERSSSDSTSVRGDRRRISDGGVGLISSQVAESLTL
jgi:hypothetical protein